MTTLRKWLLQKLVRRRPRQALQLACERLNVVGLQIRVPRDSPLYRADGGEFVELPVDQVIAPFVLDRGHWQTEELDFLCDHSPAGSCVLIDVGANVGLISRQLVHRIPAIAAAVCFEPHPGNFRLLQRNLAHLPQCHLLPCALGAESGELTFYEEVQNAGNYSLNVDAMRDRQFRTSTVRCVPATVANLLGSLPSELQDYPIIWKSDTQGFDEVIVTGLSDDFWNRVQCGVMELWRIARPVFDKERMAAVLAMFPILRFSNDVQRNLTVDEVLAFAAGSDYQHKDLFFARPRVVAPDTARLQAAQLAVGCG